MNWHPIGPHRYRIEDDVLYWQPAGEMTAEHVRALCAVFDELRVRYGYVLYLVDARGSRPMGYESRRQYSQWFDAHHPRLTVVGYGSPAEPRATAVLIVNAARLRGSNEVTMHSVSSEAEARALIEVARQRFRDELAAPTESAASPSEVL